MISLEIAGGYCEWEWRATKRGEIKEEKEEEDVDVVGVAW